MESDDNVFVAHHHHHHHLILLTPSSPLAYRHQKLQKNLTDVIITYRITYRKKRQNKFVDRNHSPILQTFFFDFVCLFHYCTID